MTINLSDGSRIKVVVKNGSGRITSMGLKDNDNRSSEYNTAIDGIESLILAHACAGVDVSAPPYVKGIEVAVEAIVNNLT